tara:strand:- start:9 stop:449 length:441 start_codon:yes stop_codon:yes gene_type:complete
MEGIIIMNRITQNIINYILLTLFSFLMADDKSKNGDNIFSLNSNISNKELRLEINNLQTEFNVERKRIMEFYDKEIDTLITKRESDMQLIKADFSERREILFNKYAKQGSKSSPNQELRPKLNSADQPEKLIKKKTIKDKKKIRKP